MRIGIEHPANLTRTQEKEINAVASAGFGANPETMMADTRQHIESADYVQQARINGETVGFALYRRCLWQPSY